MKKFGLIEKLKKIHIKIFQELGIYSKCCGKRLSTYGYDHEYCMTEYGGCGKKQ